MIIRSARESDIPGIMDVRSTVKENRLVDPSLLTEELCRSYILERGKGWVCLRDDLVAGFGVVDFQENRIWALVVRPEYEGYACSDKLHELLLNWYFAHQSEPVWLSAAPGSTTESFCVSRGWTKTGTTEDGATRLEISKEAWRTQQIEEEAE